MRIEENIAKLPAARLHDEWRRRQHRALRRLEHELLDGYLRAGDPIREVDLDEHDQALALDVVAELRRRLDLPSDPNE